MAKLAIKVGIELLEVNRIGHRKCREKFKKTMKKKKFKRLINMWNNSDVIYMPDPTVFRPVLNVLAKFFSQISIEQRIELVDILEWAYYYYSGWEDTDETRYAEQVIREPIDMLLSQTDLKI